MKALPFYPGLVMFNSSSQEWSNLSSTGYSYYGFTSNSMAHFMPTFGTAGLFLVFGGYTTKDEQMVPFQSISMYDPITQEWQSQVSQRWVEEFSQTNFRHYAALRDIATLIADPRRLLTLLPSLQQASGDIPGIRECGCVVGVEGDDGTYEVPPTTLFSTNATTDVDTQIFLYGGRILGDAASTISSGAVHVLSLPSFQWKMLAAPQQAGRYMHSCNLSVRAKWLL